MDMITSSRMAGPCIGDDDDDGALENGRNNAEGEHTEPGITVRGWCYNGLFTLSVFLFSYLCLSFSSFKLFIKISLCFISQRFASLLHSALSFTHPLGFEQGRGFGRKGGVCGRTLMDVPVVL